MNTKIKFLRFVFALALALSALGVSTFAALAAQPAKYEFTIVVSDVLTDVCSFPVGIESAFSGTGIDFFDASGALTRIFNHVVSQDKFTANGKELVGIPYTWNGKFLFDSSGNLTHFYVVGVFEKIPLPDGSLFVSAGVLDVVAHPGVMFFISPDMGNPGNVAGFCAALSS